MRNLMTYAASLTLAGVALLAPHVARAQNVSKTAMAGAYTVTLKVLPAEAFEGKNAEMVRDGGSEPNLLNGSEPPNHHLVAFVKKDGKPVEKGIVNIDYRPAGGGTWLPLPVVRMHVKGKGLDTTHFGNNLSMVPGNYDARVTVNGSPPAIFHFAVAGGSY